MTQRDESYSVHDDPLYWVLLRLARWWLAGQLVIETTRRWMWRKILRAEARRIIDDYRAEWL